MGDQCRIAWIGQDRIQRLHQTQAAIGFPQQQNAAIAGNVTSAKVRFDFSAIEAWKSQFGVGTIWH